MEEYIEFVPERTNETMAHASILYFNVLHVIHVLNATGFVELRNRSWRWCSAEFSRQRPGERKNLQVDTQHELRVCTHLSE